MHLTSHLITWSLVDKHGDVLPLTMSGSSACGVWSARGLSHIQMSTGCCSQQLINMNMWTLSQFYCAKYWWGGGRMRGLACCSPLEKTVSHYISGQEEYSIMQKHLRMLVLILLAGTCQTQKVTRSNRGGGLIISGGVINLHHAPASRGREKQKAQPSPLTHPPPPPPPHSSCIILSAHYNSVGVQICTWSCKQFCILIPLFPAWWIA